MNWRFLWCGWIWWLTCTIMVMKTNYLGIVERYFYILQLESSMAVQSFRSNLGYWILIVPWSNKWDMTVWLLVFLVCLCVESIKFRSLDYNPIGEIWMTNVFFGLLMCPFSQILTVGLGLNLDPFSKIWLHWDGQCWLDDIYTFLFVDMSI